MSGGHASARDAAGLDLERIRSLVTSGLGLRLDDGRAAELVEVTRERMQATGCDGPAAYAARLAAAGTQRAELHELGARLAVAETYFFRGPGQMRVFVEAVRGDHARTRGSSGRMRVLSAGCASGEEPYSLAILARQALGETAADRLSIAAIDVSAPLLRRAAEARYGPWALRATPLAVRATYFRSAGRADHVVDPTVAALVRFEHRNLLEDDAGFWRPGAFDAIFCRNVLMYFSRPAMEAAIRLFARSLAPGGLLFLGEAETLRGASDAFELRHAHDAFYYRLRSQTGAPRPSGAPEPEAPAALAAGGDATAGDATPAAPVAHGGGWVEAIRRASERIATLGADGAATAPAERTATARNRREPSAGPPRAAAAQDLGPAWQLLAAERFADAAAFLAPIAPTGAPDEGAPGPECLTEALLLRAVALVYAGDVEASERACRALLARDGLHADAHYAMALHREHAGDLAGALEHVRIAAYLDPSFAMPHLHTGIAHERAGEATEARRSLGLALERLSGEAASRILLFGGGFPRDGLIAVCRAQLRALEALA